MAPERPGPEDERCGSSVLLHANGVTVPMVRQSLTLTCDLLKEGDGATKVFTEVRVGSATNEDDDLTPLSWLQDRNLLKGIALRAGPMCPEGSGGGGEARARRIVVEEVAARMGGSPTSDYADDSSEQADSSSSSGPPSSPTPTAPQLPPIPEIYEPPPQSTHPSIIPYNPKIHITSKPPYSFSCLIFMAIEDCTQRALPVKDIYAWILDHFPYFQGAPTGWKNSVRHNLSLNKCFKKVDKSPNVGKGSLWMVDPMYRPNLLQALRKAPFHPYMQVDRLAPTNGPVPPFLTSSLNGTPASGNSSSNSSEYSVPVLLSAPVPPAPANRSNLPNPTLFPFLSRRLAAAGLGLPCPPALPPRPALLLCQDEEDEDSDSRDDVDAATAMMALKHGPRILLPSRDDWYKRLRDEGTGLIPALDASKSLKPRHRSSFIVQPQQQQQGANKSLVITTSPSEDHTYSAGPTIANPTTNGSRSALSPDEAFGEGSASSAESCHEKGEEVMESDEEEEEEQRKIAEGADALLNLAGICTAGSGRGAKRGITSLPPRQTSKRQRLAPEKTVRSKRQQVPQPPRSTWKKASLHQGSRVHKSKSKEKSNRHRR